MSKVSSILKMNTQKILISNNIALIKILYM